MTHGQLNREPSTQKSSSAFNGEFLIRAVIEAKKGASHTPNY